MKLLTKWLYAGTLTVLLTACGQQPEQREHKAIRVKTETVSALGASLQTAHGYVGVVEENQATIASYTSMGTLRRVTVSEGQTVSRGQLIAEMDDTQARNLLATAEAQSRQAEDALARYSQLHAQGSMTDAQWVEVQSKVEQARSQLAIARRNVDDCRLTAPVSGIIGKRYLAAGETALPSQPVVNILDISTVKVKIAVPEREMANIKPTMPTTITIEAIGRVCHGGLIEKGVQADALTHTYDVRVRVDNKGRELLPGMVAKVVMGDDRDEMKGEGASSVMLTVPLTAVQKRAEGSMFVWTVDANSTAHRTTVSIGQTTGNRIEICSGLSEGAQVVTEGYQKLSEGSKVVI